MKFSSLYTLLRYYWQFNPFRFNFILFLAIVWLAKKYLLNNTVETSSFLAITLLMAKIAFFFAALIVAISFLSSSFCFLYFIYQKKKKGLLTIEINMDLASYKNNTLRIQTKLPFALKPILGFVKVRLVYDKYQLSEKFIVSDRTKKQLFSFNTGLQGLTDLSLPDIQEYYFSNAFISFEDMLQFFTFTTINKAENSICNLPHSLLQETHELAPKKTEEEKVRIEQLRKVEGEMLNYKKFEDADDVRRIVWKIFAKNKELVVRVPEIMDPFASHIYMYASFYNQQDFKLHSSYYQIMSNHYKNCVWTIYDALAKKEFEVRFIHDQLINNPGSEHDNTQNSIALSSWHQDKHLIDYFKPKSGSVLCVHSFTSEHELAQIVSSCDANTNIFFIQLSKVFKSHYIINWMIHLFFKPQKDKLTSLRNKWAIHPLKFQTLRHEKALLSLLQKSDCHVEII